METTVIDKPVLVAAVADPAAVLRATLKEQKRRAARENLHAFIEYCMPDPLDYDNVEKTRYDAQPFHLVLIDMFMAVSLKEKLRAAVSLPPQHGKTTIFGEYGMAWHAGRNPDDKIIFATYNEDRAGIVGGGVMAIFESERFREVFPEFRIRTGEASKTLIGFGERGSIMFIGVGGGASGNPCDLFVIDDPYKGQTEAKSPKIQKLVWTWYCSVVEARCPATTPIIIIHTRWSDNDLMGRLCDKTHPDYSPEDNDEFDYLNIPAIVDDPELADLLGLGPGSALWAETWDYRRRDAEGKPLRIKKWPLELLARIRKKNPLTFSAVYMGQPVPPEGDHFTMQMVYPYNRDQLPSGLRIYAASDHALGEGKGRDKSCLGCFGIDAKGTVWILPDLVWKQIPSNVQVETMLTLIKRHKPRTWYAGKDHIKKAIGPFLRIRMRATGRLCAMKELPENNDKIEKSESIRALMSCGMVRLPKFAPWYSNAVAQLLRFDGSDGRPDDFVDFMGVIGRGIDTMLPGEKDPVKEEKEVKTGTAAWIRMKHKEEQRAKAREKATGGW